MNISSENGIRHSLFLFSTLKLIYVFYTVMSQNKLKNGKSPRWVVGFQSLESASSTFLNTLPESWFANGAAGTQLELMRDAGITGSSLTCCTTILVVKFNAFYRKNLKICGFWLLLRVLKGEVRELPEPISCKSKRY